MPVKTFGQARPLKDMTEIVENRTRTRKNIKYN